jgi:cytochrome c oxidase subunit 3
VYAREVPHGEEPHEHLSPWPLAVGIGVALLYYGILFRGPALGLAIIVFLSALYGWLYEDYSRWRKGPSEQEEHKELPADASRFQRMLARPTAWWGVVIFLLTEIMLFGGLFAIYFNAQNASPAWPPKGAVELPVFSTFLNTVLLISSGVTMHLGMIALRRQSRTWFLVLYLGTIILGAGFLFNQISEYIGLFGEGFNLSSGVYGASFYLLTGVHGAHVTAGLVGLIVVFGRGLSGQFNKERHIGLEGVAIYWHFVDFVWIFLFIVVYVLPSVGFRFFGGA